MERTDLLQHLADDVDAIAGVLAASPSAPIRHCPGWDVAELVRHHGEVHRWATEIVRSGELAPDDERGPEDLAELAGWYREGADRLLDVLATTDPERPCWTFGWPPGVAGFWTRRQSLEAAVHRWDAEVAAGRSPSLDPGLCAAGIDEVAEVMQPRQVALDRTPAPTGPIVLRALDLDRTWELPGGGAPAVEIAGPAEVLLLLLWRRADLDDGRVALTGATERRVELAEARFAP